jgi:hypothetical protein
MEPIMEISRGRLLFPGPDAIATPGMLQTKTKNGFCVMFRIEAGRRQNAGLAGKQTGLSNQASGSF